MKKYFFILLLCAGSFFTVTAQGHFQLGLKLGYSSTSFSTDNASGFLSELDDYSFLNAKDDFKSGYNIGVYSRIGLVGNLSLQPEFYFSKKSGVTNYSLEETATENNVAISEKVFPRTESGSAAAGTPRSPLSRIL